MKLVRNLLFKFKRTRAQAIHGYYLIKSWNIMDLLVSLDFQILTMRLLLKLILNYLVYQEQGKWNFWGQKKVQEFFI